MAIKIDMLRVFQAVAEEGALAQAAERLARSPSAVSMMLSRFEEEIGAPLFETERKGRLTPLGRLVLEESRRATENFSRSLTAIRRHAQSVAGTLRVAAVPRPRARVCPRSSRIFSGAVIPMSGWKSAMPTAPAFWPA
ncbi:MAG: LysR family transcriptional regulator [Paracoccaceae bacterium]